ncbi:MAG: UDP-N-acetylglucosamine 1-carboxyvinyltransferase [Oscillospiraceae bacterium]|nr:UDP-N-acetylglucosamine 1-carboxyvinyltransferase [Oscillospiraceae bacterium]
MSMPQTSFLLHKAPILRGSLSVPSAKNSVLPLLAAALLCDTPVRLCRVPALADVTAACGILSELGRPALWQGGDLILEAKPLQTSVLPACWMERMRSGVFFLAPVLARTGRVEFCAPGGCNLGARPVDIHLEGLCRMGAVCEQKENCMVLRAPQGLHGCNYALRLPSVGATETMLMAAAAAKGVTRLDNAAVEPEVLDLARFINACGGCVRQLPGRRFIIRGTGGLRGSVFTPTADRIWCATVLCAVAGCTGEVELTGIDPAALSGLPQLLQRAGCRVEVQKNAIFLSCTGRLQGLGMVRTAPFPGFATDMAPLLAAAMLRAQGFTTICDTVFTHRFACAQGFAALGAPVCLRENCLTVGTLPEEAAPVLHAAPLQAQDLRGGAALVLAALQAEGESRLHGVEYIRRGYADLPGALGALGAQIRGW